jgi:AcrR family transcriptional regulator
MQVNTVGRRVLSADVATPSKGERTAQRILDAAESLFAERGYYGTTLRDVAAAVGIRNPSLYNHFSSKESLYGAVLQRGIRPLLDALTEFLARADDTDGGPREIVETMMDLLAQRPSIARLVQHETLSGGQRLTDMLREWITPVFARAQELVESNPAAARWSPEQIPLLVLAMYHVVVGYFTIAPLYHELNGDDLMSPAALERQTRFFGDLVELLLGDFGHTQDRQSDGN